MLTKNQIKLILSLEQKKFRKESGLFVAEGKKAVTEILNSSLKIHSLYSTKIFFNTLSQFPNTPQRKFEKNEIEEADLKRISFLTTPNEVLCLVEIPKHQIILEKIGQALSFYLDNLKDPGNFGNIIRIADWFGIENIFCSAACVDAYNPKVVQATMGSIARVKINYVENENFFDELKKITTRNKLSGDGVDFKIYSSALSGKNIYKEKLSPTGLILLGNESEGVSEKLIQIADEKLTIPSFGKAESLNVAASAGIICSEFRRRLGR